jgi:hypothetical protein
MAVTAGRDIVEQSGGSGKGAGKRLAGGINSPGLGKGCPLGDELP